MQVIKTFGLPSLFRTMAGKLTSKYVFVDLEMTGLEPETEEIMEVACVVTTEQLEPMHSGYSAAIHVDDKKLSEMNQWCITHHAKSGLTEACRKSKLSLEEVEKQLIDYVKKYSDSKDLLYLAGNSIFGDRIFLRIYMKEFHQLLHYRSIDVSSIKTLCYGWYPHLSHIQKKRNHRALDDVHESIAELKFYRRNIFK